MRFQRSLIVTALTSSLAVLAAVPASGAPVMDSGAYADSVLYSFGVKSRSGSYPWTGALTLGQDGNFYGATPYGGANGSGILFRMKPDGSLVTLHSFGAATNGGGIGIPNADGSQPAGGLVQGPDGSFFGVAPNGGSNGYGTVFRITPRGAFKVLHNFTSPDPTTLVNADGTAPNASLLLAADGSLYGTTFSGGQYGKGVAYHLTRNGSFSTLFNFGAPLSDTEAGASHPQSGLIQGADGNFYGTTTQGGPSGESDGSAYQLTPTGTMTVLHWFNRLTDGAQPTGALAQGNDGALYGTTLTASIFRLTTDGQFSVLHWGNDQGPYVGNAINIDTSIVYPGLTLGPDGYFYGTMELGGEFSQGSLFRISPSGDYVTLYYFGGVAQDASSPYSGVIFGADGNLYGTTSSGGSTGKGTVYRMPLPAPDGWGQGPVVTVQASLSPTVISQKQGQTATLTWTTTNAATCYLNQSQPLAANGSLAIPASSLSKGTHEYFMVCDSAGKATEIKVGNLDVTR